MRSIVSVLCRFGSVASTTNYVDIVQHRAHTAYEGNKTCITFRKVGLLNKPARSTGHFLWTICSIRAQNRCVKK